MTSKLSPPANTVEAVRLARAVARRATWGTAISSLNRSDGPAAFSAGLLQRFDIAVAPGSRAVRFARRLLPGTLDPGEVEMTVSPYAPPMRQLSSVRQGVPMWSAGAAQRAEPAAPPPMQPSTPRPVPAATPPAARRSEPKKDKIPDDLMAILNMHRALGRIK